jgi:hypothetical protein
VENIKKEWQTKNATLAVFCTLDDITYLFNVRASMGTSIPVLSELCMPRWPMIKSSCTVTAVKYDLPRFKNI